MSNLNVNNFLHHYYLIIVEPPPFGINGDDSGEIGKNWIKRANLMVEELEGCAQAKICVNDSINIQTPTGGGFGKKQG